ncbi:MAG: GNAT family N-acetyltransferase [Paracoccaceae bacterium]|nr:GNAT family N-acetyltransferase [Paracoccaceae bacterium]
MRAIEPQDIELVRQWRNAQMDVLRQKAPINPDAQKEYFAKQVWPQKALDHPTQILFAIERDGTLVGYGGLVHISWPNRRAEISFLLSPDLEADSEARAKLFHHYLRLVQTIAFADLHLARLFTETFEHRTAHIASLETAGMRLEGQLRHHAIVNDKPTDSLMHGILAQEWEALP